MTLHAQQEIIKTQQEGSVWYLKLNRPEKRNALNDATLQRLECLFNNIPETVRCLVLSSEGPHFSAGLDLSELTERDLAAGMAHSRMWHKVLESIQFCKAPVIVVLQGACVGGGLELASACHIRIAEESTFFALPEGQRGIFLGGGGSVRLPRLIGLANVMDMMLTGRVYNAIEGHAVGLSQYQVANGKGLELAKELADKIAANAPMTNYAITQVLPRIAEGSFDSGLMMEALIAAIAQDSQEAKQRMQAFLDGKAKKVGE